MLNISIKAEPIAEFFGFPITNSLLTSFIVLAILVAVSLYYQKQLERKKKSRIFYLMQYVIRAIYRTFESINKEKINTLFPLVGAFFFFILFQNWFGLLPGVGSILVPEAEHGAGEAGKTMIPLLRGGNADLNTTLVLGIVAVIAIQYYGIKYLGLKGYISKYINFKDPINFFLGLLEIVSEFSRVLSFSFRLFGNVFAGEVVLLVIAFLIPVLASFPFFIMEIFVGFIQALVFSMLVSVFLQIATAKSH
ncbi:F0F1 ATP synthase subunit A [Candidatus Roizmanbacteria bacterium]|nr:F0F1 ATP synthase subunit A [Candidatus Roizmanbacteria bacterium]